MKQRKKPTKYISDFFILLAYTLMVKFQSTIYPPSLFYIILSEAYITESTPYLSYKDHSAYIFVGK
jgi:hypothetical protein